MLRDPHIRVNVKQMLSILQKMPLPASKASQKIPEIVVTTEESCSTTAGYAGEKISATRATTNPIIAIR